MRTAWLAFRAAFYAGLFLWGWGWVALRTRAFDRYLPLQWPAWVSTVGAAIAVAGAVLAIACVRAFVVRGRGTAAPFDAPRRFVAAGPYRFVRNPMYVGGLAMLAGSALYLNSPAMLLFSACFWMLAHLFVVCYEEPHLSGLFGDEYARYRQQVPRWFRL